jgi:hypothetical protein
VFSGHGLKLGSGDVGPWQEIVDLAVCVAVDDPGEHVGEIAERFGVVELAGLCRTANYAERAGFLQCFHDVAVAGSA